MNVSVPESVDAEMTKSVLQDHGVGASASLVSIHKNVFCPLAWECLPDYIHKAQHLSDGLLFGPVLYSHYVEI